MTAGRTTDTTLRSPGEVYNSPSILAALSRRDQVLISACAALLTAAAWSYLFTLNAGGSSSVSYETMMAEMGMPMNRPWTGVDVFFTFIMWAVMMVGMMAGSALPTLLLFAAASRARSGGRLSVVTAMFAAGYIAVWVAFSVLAALGQWGLHEAAMLSPAMRASNAFLAAGILIGAGIYQLLPIKNACLAHCQTPLGFLMTHWRDGATGALQMGVRHGVYCVGCCWALMCVLFVVGVMNLVWVAVLSALVLLEKVGPSGPLIARLSGTAMIVGGLLFLRGSVGL